MEQQLLCSFIDGNWTNMGIIYTCKIEYEEVGTESLLKFKGNHLPGKSNYYVLGISFRNCIVRTIPKRLKETFPNLKYLEISDSKLRNVTRESLKEYPNLKTLWLTGNEIAFVPGNLLLDLQNLEVLSLYNSKVEFMEPNIFDSCTKLKYVELRQNICIDKCFNSVDPNLHNSTLEEIKAFLQKTYPSWGDKVQNVKGEITSEVLKLLKQISEKENDFASERFKFDVNLENFKKESSGKVKSLEQEISEVKEENKNLKLKVEFFKDFKTLMENEEFKDFTIKTELEEFKAHKFVLAARSSLFANLIKENINAECLNLLDVSTNIFRIILNFIYTDEFPEITNINFIELFKASKRLKIEKLKNFAAEKLLDEINSENALEILALSIKYKYEGLRKKSFEEIKKFLDFSNIDENLEFEPEKLKKLIEIKKEKDEMMKEFEGSIEYVLNQE